MQAFRPSPPHDLLRPLPGSTTARAIASLVRRTRFEAWKAYRPSGLPDDVAHDLEVLRSVFERFLPGNPHAVASVLALPGVGSALRRAVGGARTNEGSRAAPDPSAVPELCTSALLALFAEGALPFEVTLRAAVPAVVPARDVVLERLGRDVRLGERVEGGVVRPAGVTRARVGVWQGSDAGALDAALDRLDAERPGSLANLRRVAFELVPASTKESGLPKTFGRFEVSTCSARALDVERVRHLLGGLSEVDDLAADPGGLVEAAVAFVAGEPIDLVRLEAVAPTEVGRGVVAELRRLV
ncbi:MAG: hypothetical protein H6721_02745 [Sandaracinus sp.]|nr:hypothetical protein [Sandaracinus sp.]MCB9631052.1 hypothetical protein [Sandaracinus sp.]